MNLKPRISYLCYKHGACGIMTLSFDALSNEQILEQFFVYIPVSVKMKKLVYSYYIIAKIIRTFFPEK